MSIRIAIAGAAGRMGQALVKSAGADFAIAGGSERPGAPGLGQDQGGWTLSDGSAKAAQAADVWIDFTTPQATLEALDQLRSTKVKAAIIGTTGLSPNRNNRSPNTPGASPSCATAISRSAST